MVALLNCMFTPTFKPLNFDKKKCRRKISLFQGQKPVNLADFHGPLVTKVTVKECFVRTGWLDCLIHKVNRQDVWS